MSSENEMHLNMEIEQLSDMLAGEVETNVDLRNRLHALEEKEGWRVVPIEILERCYVMLREQADLLRRAEMSVENCDMYRERVAELEALLDECRLSLCPFDCKLLLLRIDTAIAKRELSE